MAHLAAAWPDQVLCKENKRKALNAQHDSWMRQRELALQEGRQQSGKPAAPASVTPAAAPAAAAAPVTPAAPPARHEEELDDEQELDEITAFLDGVGRSIGA